MAPCTEPTTESSGAIEEPREDKKMAIVKKNILVFGYGHLAALYGLYLAFTSAKWGTIFFAYACYVVTGIGLTAGAHRLWAHRAYKAKWPLQVVLMVMYSVGFQNTVATWVRDHRLHHRHSDTDADPHNASRGFFFSHIGWLLVRKNESVRRAGRAIDMTDIYGNPVLMFQKRYAVPFIGTVCFLLPTILPMLLFGETLTNAWHLNIFRYVFSLHMAFIINSAVHKWGNKPYDNRIMPTQNILVSIFSFGEGFHNYHHVFPWDYRTAELGNNWLNAATVFIDMFAWIGWAYDLKSVSDDVVRSRAMRTGDGTNSWGWGDIGMGDDIKEICNKVD